MKLVNLVNGTSAMNTVSHEVLAQTIVQNTTEMNGVRFASVPVGLLRIDESYQRPLDKNHVNTLAINFKKAYAGCLTVSYRDGWFYIIDGQHRYSAALIKEIEALSCIIVTGLTSKDEAKMFKDLNINHKKPDPYKLFKANVWNGDTSDPEVAADLQIKRICDKYNIEIKKVSRGSTGKALRCLTRARNIVGSTSYDGIACFEWIIDILNMTNWSDDHNAYRKEIISMLRNCFVDNRDVENIDKKLINALNSTTPTMFINKAKHDYNNYGTETATGLLLRDMILGTN